MTDKNIKFSELELATTLQDSDIIPIVQEGKNKIIDVKQLEETVTSDHYNKAETNHEIKQFFNDNKTSITGPKGDRGLPGLPGPAGRPGKDATFIKYSAYSTDYEDPHGLTIDESLRFIEIKYDSSAGMGAIVFKTKVKPQFLGNLPAFVELNIDKELRYIPLIDDMGRSYVLSDKDILLITLQESDSAKGTYTGLFKLDTINIIGDKKIAPFHAPEIALSVPVMLGSTMTGSKVRCGQFDLLYSGNGELTVSSIVDLSAASSRGINLLDGTPYESTPETPDEEASYKVIQTFISIVNGNNPISFSYNMPFIYKGQAVAMELTPDTKGNNRIVVKAAGIPLEHEPSDDPLANEMAMFTYKFLVNVSSIHWQ